MMTNLMTILERKVFISSNPRIVLSSCPPPCGHFSIQESATGGLSYKGKKESCLQASPPAAGRLERQLPFRRSAILPGRAFYVIGNSNGISYYIKNCPQVSPMDSYHLIRSSQCLGCAFIYTSRIRLIFMLKYT